MTTKLRTHYDNLMVSRNAPEAVIKAAYRTLTQKYHPDRNPGDADSARIMVLLNESWAVLSDPDKRRQHDDWIRRSEESAAGQQHSYRPPPREPPRPPPREPPRPPPKEPPREPPPAPPRGPPPAPPKPPPAATVVPAKSSTSWWLPMFVVGLILLVGRVVVMESNRSAKLQTSPGSTAAAAAEGAAPELSDADSAIAAYEAAQPSEAQAPPEVSAPAPVVAASTYVREPTGLDGEPWPSESGYVGGFELLANGGLCQVIVDNSKNSGDVLVKLYALDQGSTPVRTFFIPAYSSFKLENVDAGQYDIRYRDLDSGALARSEPFSLKQTVEAEGTRYSVYTMTLYTVANGNLNTYPISETEF